MSVISSYWGSTMKALMVVLAFVTLAPFVSAQWTPFSPSAPDDEVESMAVVASGPAEGLYVTGDFLGIGAIPNTGTMARYSATSSSWSSVGIAPVFLAFVDMQEYGGNLYATSGIANTGADVEFYNGTSWSPCGGGSDGNPTALTNYNMTGMPGSQLLVAGGSFNNVFNAAGGALPVAAPNLAAWNGASWSNPFGAGPSGAVQVLATRGTELYAVTAGVNIERFSSATWTSIGMVQTSIFAYVSDMTEFNGDLFICGQFSSILTPSGTVMTSDIARWDGSTWNSVPTIAGVTTDELTNFAVHNGQLFVGEGDATFNKVLRLDAAGLTPVGALFNEDVEALAVFNGALVAGGEFTTNGAMTIPYLATLFNSMSGTYPGSHEDFVLSTGINGPPTPIVDVKSAAAFDILNVTIDSPSGGLVGYIPVLLASPFTTGTTITPIGGFPEVQVDPNNVFVLFNGNSSPFGIGLLPAQGLSFSYAVPTGVSGMNLSLMLQGLALTPTLVNPSAPPPANGFFAATNGHEIIF